jgi:hypothetical protein
MSDYVSVITHMILFVIETLKNLFLFNFIENITNANLNLNTYCRSNVPKKETRKKNNM